MAETQSNIQSAQDRLVGGVHTMAKKAERVIDTGAEKLDQAVNTASSKISEVNDSAQEYTTELLEQAQEAYDRVLQEGRKRANQLEKDIKKAPFTSVGIAFVGGVVLASLLKR